jgi:hypothetical protein
MDPEHLKREIESAQMPLDKLKGELEALESGSFSSLGDDELREKVKQIHTGFVVQAPILPEGTLIYRAVRVTQRPSSKAHISYPPPEVVNKCGRCSRAGEVIFYGALNQFASCLQECSWRPSEFFAVSAWLTKEKMAFNHLGYSTVVLKSFKALRELPYFATIHNDSDRNLLIRDWQAKIFTQRVPSGDEHLYRLPITLKEAALWKIGQPHPTGPDLLSGIIYPSIAMWALGDNVAILPSEVDKKMALLEVILLTLDSVDLISKDDGSTDTRMQVKTYDYAREGDDGRLVWGQRTQIIHPDGVDASTFSPQILPPDSVSTPNKFEQ